MLIRDFYSRLASSQEDGALFKALRRLSLVEDVKHLSGEESDDASRGAWAMWTDASGPSQQPVLRRA